MVKDYLMRQDAPFTKEQWNRIDELVVKVAKDRLVGRKAIKVFGPLGPEQQSIEVDTVDIKGKAHVDKWGNEEEGMIEIANRRYMPIPLLYKDLILSWRDIETANKQNRPLDTSLIAAATSELAKKEDDLIFNGSEEVEGVMNVDNRLVVEKGDWDNLETPYKDVAKGLEELMKADSYGPYALVVSPDMYVKMQRIQEGTGVTVLSRVKELVEGRVYQTPVLESNKGVLMAIGNQHMDLVIGEDMVTAYIGDEKLNHMFRLLETIALRIKRPQSICTIE